MKREGGLLGALLRLFARITPALLKPLGIGALTGAAGFGLLRKMTGQGLRLAAQAPPSSGRGLKKPLNNVNIEAAARKMKIRHWRGVFMRDDLPADGAQKRERGIVNLDSAEGAGTH